MLIPILVLVLAYVAPLLVLVLLHLILLINDFKAVLSRVSEHLVFNYKAVL